MLQYKSNMFRVVQTFLRLPRLASQFSVGKESGGCIHNTVLRAVLCPQGEFIWWLKWWWIYNVGGYQVVVPLGKVLGWLYLLGKWVRLFNPFASKASGLGR
jgi:hypothetical protein